MKAAVRHEQPIRNQQVQVRMPPSIVTKGLDCGHGADLANIGVGRGFEEKREPAVGTVAQFAQQLMVISKVAAQNFRKGKNILAVRDGGENLAAEQIPEENNFFRVATRTEPTSPTTEREQLLLAAVGAAHEGKAFAQITAFQITADHIVDNRTPVAASPAELLLIFPLECRVMLIKKLPQGRLLRLSRVVNGRTASRRQAPSCASPWPQPKTVTDQGPSGNNAGALTSIEL